MKESVKKFIESVVRDQVTAVNIGRVVECRLNVEGNVGLHMGLWICLETIEKPECEGSDKLVRYFWAHTNDFDPMVYGWSACELYVVERDPQVVYDKTVAFLAGKLEHQDRVEIKLFPRVASGQKELAILTGDSDSGADAIHEMPDRNLP